MLNASSALSAEWTVCMVNTALAQKVSERESLGPSQARNPGAESKGSQSDAAPTSTTNPVNWSTGVTGTLFSRTKSSNLIA
jgi:hypothetical protein